MDCIYSATYIPALLTYFSRLVSNAAAVVSPKCNPQDFFHQHWTFLHQPIASDDGGRTQGQGEPGGTSDSSVHSSTVSSSQITVEVALKFFQSTLKPDFAFSSVQFSRSIMSDSLRPRELQLARPPCPSPYPRVHSNSCPSSWWCHPTISSSVVPLSSCPQSLPASTLHMRWPKYWSFNFSIIPSKEHPGLITFRMDWLDPLAVQGTLKSLLQHHSSKASILWCSAFFTVQLSHPYMTTGKTIALTRRTFVGKVMSLLYNMP